jgi:DNA-binding HxlR family transcriptional regulator
MEKAERKKKQPVSKKPLTVGAMTESIVGCKWSLQVLAAVRGGVHRPGELERACEGISTKVLGERLRKLCRFEILSRYSYPEIPPRVEYHFTPFGERFLVLLDEIERLQQEKNEGAFADDAGDSA